MNSNNPYAAPDDTPEPVDGDLEFLVQDDLLIAGQSVFLPDRCIFTNQPTPWRNRVTTRLSWYGRFGQIVIRTKRCRISFALCNASRISWRIQKGGGAILFLGVAVLLVTAVGTSLLPKAIAAILIGTGWFMKYRLQSPRLKIVRSENGRFWIAGLSREFLDELEREKNEEEFAAT